MQKRILMLVTLFGLSLHAAKEQDKHQEKTVTFINEDENAKVKLTIFDSKTGEEQVKKNLSSNGKFTFTVPHDMDLAISAKEFGEDGLETGMYHVWIRTQDMTGTIRIKRGSALMSSEDELIFIGNKEADQEGAFVRKPLMKYSWDK